MHSLIGPLMTATAIIWEYSQAFPTVLTPQTSNAGWECGR